MYNLSPRQIESDDNKQSINDKIIIQKNSKSKAKS